MHFFGRTDPTKDGNKGKSSDEENETDLKPSSATFFAKRTPRARSQSQESDSQLGSSPGSGFRPRHAQLFKEVPDLEGQNVDDSSSNNLRVSNTKVRTLRKGFGYHRKGKVLKPSWVIAEPSISFCEALWQYFYNIESVKLVAMSFIKIDPIDFSALVVNGNCLGIPEQTRTWIDLRS